MIYRDKLLRYHATFSQDNTWNIGDIQCAVLIKADIDPSISKFSVDQIYNIVIPVNDASGLQLMPETDFDWYMQYYMTHGLATILNNVDAKQLGVVTSGGSFDPNLYISKMMVGAESEVWFSGIGTLGLNTVVNFKTAATDTGQLTVRTCISGRYLQF